MPTSARVIDLRSQVPASVLAAGSDPIRLSWRVVGAAAGERQVAYETQSSRSATFETVDAVASIEDDRQIAVPAPGAPLRSREVRFYRVRITTTEGRSEWSAPIRIEASLLATADWSAQAVTLPDDPGREGQAPAPLVRRRFELGDEVVSARLYVTALGLHRIRINGRSVSGDLLGPGWTPYAQRLLFDTYDVTDLLRRGENVIASQLGDGWYRGRLGWDVVGGRCTYGSDVGLIAQLEIRLRDGSDVLVTTDGEWHASTGAIRRADFYDGATVDLREERTGWDQPGYDDAEWQPVALVPFDPAVLEPRVAEPVRVIATLPVQTERRPDGSIVLDGGQNISGFVRLRVRGSAGDEVVLRHAEVLEPDGSLHTRSLRTAEATDRFILAGDEPVLLEPPFTFHGFRYAEVVTDAEILDAEFAAISSDTPPRSTFSSSEPALDRLHQNVVWSLRDNFVSLPTDCPQRDERLGWTGDALAFVPTASTLVDAEAFWASWLRDLDLEQDDELGVPAVVPNVVLEDEARYGRAGWADAAVVVPLAVHAAYGDVEVLRAQLPSMRRWVASLVGRAGDDGLLGPSFQFGDWLDPDAPSNRPWEAKVDSTFLANAFFAHSARQAARASRIIGDQAAADEYGRIADAVAAATWERWQGHALTNQTGCAALLHLGVAPPADRERVGATLAGLIRDAGGRIATGFLGTAMLMPALAATGHWDEAFTLLLRRDAPSWLYQVDMGATTVWERWDAIRPDGSIHDGLMDLPEGAPDPGADVEPHMLSFNHYAYGSVIDWVYRHVGGIAPDPDDAGYRTVVFAPRPARALDRASASVESGYGMTSIDWQVAADGALEVDVDIPFGASGRFEAPTTPSSEVSLDGSAAASTVPLGSGRHHLSVTHPAIAGGADA